MESLKFSRSYRFLLNTHTHTQSLDSKRVLDLEPPLIPDDKTVAAAALEPRIQLPSRKSSLTNPSAV